MPWRGGSSRPGDGAMRGEREKLEPESEISEGAPSMESDLETSDVDGDGRDEFMCRCCAEQSAEMVSGRAGRANERDCDLSSKSLGRLDEAPRRTTRRRRRFMLPFHQFLTALSLRPCSLLAISAHRLPISATRRSI